MKIFEDLHFVIGIVILGVFFYFFAQEQYKGSLLIEDFRGKISVDTVDTGSSPDSSIFATASTEISRCGSQSLQLTYQLSPNGYVYCAKGYDLHLEKDSFSWRTERPGWLVSPKKIDWGKYEAISFYVYGDYNGKVAIDLKDTGSELWRHVIDVDFKGWQEFVVPFEDFSSRKDWQSDSAVINGFWDWPLRSFQFEVKTPGSGVVYFDCVKLIEK